MKKKKNPRKGVLCWGGLAVKEHKHFNHPGNPGVDVTHYCTLPSLFA